MPVSMSEPVQTIYRALVICRYLGLDSHLILRTSRELADSDPGLTGNLLLARMVYPLLQLCYYSPAPHADSHEHMKSPAVCYGAVLSVTVFFIAIFIHARLFQAMSCVTCLAYKSCFAKSACGKWSGCNCSFANPSSLCRHSGQVWLCVQICAFVVSHQSVALCVDNFALAGGGAHSHLSLIHI